MTLLSTDEIAELVVVWEWSLGPTGEEVWGSPKTEKSLIGEEPFYTENFSAKDKNAFSMENVRSSMKKDVHFRLTKLIFALKIEKKTKCLEHR